VSAETKDEIFARLVSEKLKSEDGPFEFEGWNCGDYDQDCDGWDGLDRRCNCGNRRVTWVLSDDKTYVYAEAY